MTRMRAELRPQGLVTVSENIGLRLLFGKALGSLATLGFLVCLEDESQVERSLRTYPGEEPDQEGRYVVCMQDVRYGVTAPLRLLFLTRTKSVLKTTALRITHLHDNESSLAT